ncbi:MAG: hypothetical protein MUO67_03815, partial [Anaerolineales bacterium]|nr:hypothetical protein [Anaerolineales bacterium]
SITIAALTWFGASGFPPTASQANATNTAKVISCEQYLGVLKFWTIERKFGIRRAIRLVTPPEKQPVRQTILASHL